jgi:hypothetical protein
LRGATRPCRAPLHSVDQSPLLEPYPPPDKGTARSSHPPRPASRPVASIARRAAEPSGPQRSRSANAVSSRAMRAVSSRTARSTSSTTPCLSSARAYPVSELAAKYGASAAKETDEPDRGVRRLCRASIRRCAFRARSCPTRSRERVMTRRARSSNRGRRVEGCVLFRPARNPTDAAAWAKEKR